MFCFNPKGVRTHGACVRRDGQATDARTRIVIHGAASMANARTEPAFVSLAGTACTAPWRAAPTTAMTTASARSRLTVETGSATVRTDGSAKAATSTWNKTAQTARTMMEVSAYFLCPLH